MSNFAADGESAWFKVLTNNGIHIGLENNFGGGTVTVQKKVNGNAYSARDSSGTAITATTAQDFLVNMRRGDEVRLSLSGSSSPNLDYSIAGVTKEGDW